MKWYHKPINKNPWLFIIPIICTLIILIEELEGDEELQSGYLVISYLIFYFITRAIIYYYKNKYLAKEHEFKVHNLIDKKLSKIINDHMDALVTLRSQLVYTDPFGKDVMKDWYEKGIKYFIDTQLRPNFSGFDEWQVDYRMNEIIEMIEREVKRRAKKVKKQVDFNVSMNGIQYEAFCKELLEKNGWSVTMTKKTGDQGVDLIASKNSIKIALQCKKYNRPVGNKAVQEVYTGKQFYNLKFGGVVSNKSFTDSAKKLAAKNGIKLLHHNDLVKLERKIG